MKNHGALYKEIIRLALPITFQQFMVALVGAGDAVMLGRLDQDAMSAVSLATQVTFAFNLFMTGLTVGENMFMAQFYGKRDYVNISKIFSLTFRSACIVAAVFWMGTLIKDGANEVRKLCLQAVQILRQPYPNVGARLFNGSAEWYYDMVTETMKLGAGNPMILNDEVMVGNLFRGGFPLEDARDYINVGCVETMINCIPENRKSWIRLISLWKHIKCRCITPCQNRKNVPTFATGF